LLERLIKTISTEDTLSLGIRLGQSFQGGEVICLYGELGAGKTILAKGLGKGLGVEEEITSPTFTLIREYCAQPTGLRFIHMDLYRLVYPEEAEVIGLTDYFQDDCVCLIEWPEIIAELLPEDRLEIRIEGSGDLCRLISIVPKGKWEAHEILND